MVRHLRGRRNVERLHDRGIGHEQVVGVTQRLGIARCAGVALTDQLGETDCPENREGLGIGQEVEVTTHHDDVLGFACHRHEAGQLLGLDASGWRVVLSCRVSKTVRVHHRDPAIVGSVDESNCLSDTWTISDGPLFVIDERSMDEG